MSDLIKKFIILNTLYHTLPIVYSTAKLTFDITSTIILWSIPKIDYCKCNVCEDYRKRFEKEPPDH